MIIDTSSATSDDALTAIRELVGRLSPDLKTKGVQELGFSIPHGLDARYVLMTLTHAIGTRKPQG